MRPFLCLLTVAALLTGCGTAEMSPSPAPAHAYGEPLDPGPPPDPAACQARIRADIAAALRIRSALAVAGAPATEAAARAAAADPTSDTATIGVPLTANELGALRASGFGFDPWSAIAYWVDPGAPERFGGMWMDSAGVVVAVVNGDPGSLALARCVAPAGTTYLWADISQAEGNGISNRLGTDMPRIRASGIEVNMTYYDVKTGLVMVGVTTPTPEITAFFVERYGPRIRVIQEGPITR